MQSLFQQDVPYYIHIGTKLNNSTAFDDSQLAFSLTPPFKITSIKVHFNSQQVTGLSIQYKSADNQLIHSTHNLCSNTLSQIYYWQTEKIFTIDDDDCNFKSILYFLDLQEINGKQSDILNRIGFLTYKGKNQNYGGSEGNHFSYKFNGFTFGLFAGEYNHCINYLRITVQPLPDHHLQSLSAHQEKKKYTSQVLYPPPSSYPQPLQDQQQQEIQSKYNYPCE